MADLDFDLQLGTAENVDFADETATTNNKVMFVLFSDKSVVFVKNSVLKEGSTDEIAITDNTKYTVKFSIADIEKLSGLQNLTYELHRWELLPQQPYTSLIYSGDVELLSPSGESEFTLAITPQTVGFANCTLANLASLASGTMFDNRVIVTTDDKVVLQNADGSLATVNKNAKILIKLVNINGTTTMSVLQNTSNITPMLSDAGGGEGVVVIKDNIEGTITWSGMGCEYDSESGHITYSGLTDTGTGFINIEIP